MGSSNYGVVELNRDTLAMLERRNIHPHPELVRIICDFSFQQLAARPRRIMRNYRARPEESFSRSRSAKIVSGIYNKDHSLRVDRIWKEINRSSLWIKFKPKDISLLTEVESALCRRMRRKDKLTRHSLPGGWNSVPHRDRNLQRLRALRAVLLVISP